MTKTKQKTKERDNRISREDMALYWADTSSWRSTCKRLQVGCVIFSNDMRKVLGYGYNGGYSGGPNECDTDEPGNCGCIHAEINALISCTREKDMVMFVTDSPCLNCAKCIINAGVTTLYYGKAYRVKDGIRLLSKKIKVIKIL
jgi:dCMP deaminase